MLDSGRRLLMLRNRDMEATAAGEGVDVCIGTEIRRAEGRIL